MRSSIATFLFCLFASLTCRAQYTLNIANGLPSDHAYMVLKDDYGYLWIATDNGLARYNGYSLKIYNSSNGLPDNDVWGLKKDHRSRIWLYGFSPTMGYIYKSQYREAQVMDDHDHILYSRNIVSHNEGVAFMANNKIDMQGKTSVPYWEINNKIWPLTEFAADFVMAFEGGRKWLQINNPDTMRIALVGYDHLNLKIKRRRFHSSVVNEAFRSDAQILPFAGYIVFAFRNNPKLCFLDTRDFKVTEIHFPDEFRIVIVYDFEDRFYAITDKNIVEINKDLQIARKIPISKYQAKNDKDAYDINYFLQDDFWGECLATSYNGVSLRGGGLQLPPDKIAWDPTGYRLLGVVDNMAYWNNAGSGKIVTMKAGDIIDSFVHTNKRTFQKIIPYSNDSLLLLGIHNLILYKRILHPSNIPVFINMRNGATVNKENVYLLSSKDMRICRMGEVEGRYTFVDNDRFNDVFYDSVHKLAWAYNKSKIIICRDSVIKYRLGIDKLSLLGIDVIEQIIPDRSFSQFVVKTPEKVLLIDIYNFRITEVFKGYNLQSAKVLRHKDDLLVVVGYFGVVTKDIKELNKPETIIFQNDKSKYYTILHDIFCLDTTLYVYTNNGIFSFPVLADSQNAINKQPYKFIVGSGDGMMVAKTGDTIQVDRNYANLSFDIVKPSGVGNLRFLAMVADVDTAFRVLPGNELSVANLKAGVYYNLYVSARDRVWKGRPLTLKVFITPYWWETNVGRNIIIIVVFTLIVAVIMISVYATRKSTARNVVKRQKELEMELKSIHSQINPHFIFNTLNTSLDFIRMRRFDSAYTHVHKFSQLLRSYLRSSRNRYITLTEEINNLRNYIDLQQARFDNVFTYKIELKSIENPDIIRLPSLLLQPLVENAINHGLLPKEEGGILLIRFVKEGEALHCTIDDNGIGRKQSKELRSDGDFKESYGDQLIKELIDLFNKYERTKIQLDYIDKQPPESGTIVHIIIENEYGNI